MRPGHVRLFFAVLPPETSARTIALLGGALQQAHQLPGRMISEERLHATLAAVNDPLHPFADVVARAKRVGTSIRHPAFPVCFDWSESFQHASQQHPLVLRGNDGLRPLIGFQRELRDQMRRAGFVVEGSFTPHITLLWTRRCVEAHPIAPIHWTVRDFALIQSDVGQSRHIHLARWQLH